MKQEKLTNERQKEQVGEHRAETTGGAKDVTGGARRKGGEAKEMTGEGNETKGEEEEPREGKRREKVELDQSDKEDR